MFSAVLIEKGEAGQTVGVAGLDEAQLSDGSDGMVSVDVECSTLNYKDGLAITRKSPVVRKFPMNACAQTRCGGALDSIAQEIGLGEAIASAGELMDGKVRGRIVVDINR